MDASPTFTRKRALVLALVAAVLALLFYLQFRTWRNFDWPRFWLESRQAEWLLVLGGVAAIYAVYPLRAWRWQVFLLPVKRTRFRDLLIPQYIGFTGLALLGRPGELTRPYLIARRVGLPFS